MPAATADASGGGYDTGASYDSGGVDDAGGGGYDEDV